MAPEFAQLFRQTSCVIFDFDGVIADSEPFSLGTLQEALEEFGLRMSLDQVRARFLGRSLKTIEAHVAKHSKHGAAKGFAETWETALFARFRADLTPMPGLLDLLDALDIIGLPHCVASSSNFRRLDVAIEALRMHKRLPNLFSAVQVPHGKPAPDLFLFAARQMQVDPRACLVIEDSPHGIQAATAAGMKSIGFVGGSHLTGIDTTHKALLLDAGATDVVHDHAVLTEGATLAHPIANKRMGDWDEKSGH